MSNSLDIWVGIHQPFLRTRFVFFSRLCKIERNVTSDWLNRMVYGNQKSCYFQMLLNKFIQKELAKNLTWGIEVKIIENASVPFIEGAKVRN